MEPDEIDHALRTFAEGHREREESKFLQKGPEAFDDKELLEVLLYRAIPRKDTLPLSRLLLGRFGSFSGVLNAGFAELCGVEGIGERTALYLKLLQECSVRFRQDSGKKCNVLNRRPVAVEYLRAHMDLNLYEELHLLALDTGCNLLRHIKVKEGAADRVDADITLLVREALSAGAARVIVAHNHPSGSPKPSGADDVVTKRMGEAFRAVGISFLDHVIIARGGEFYSYHDQSELRYLFSVNAGRAADPGKIFEYD